MIDREEIVIYESQTGFTARYALWIAEKLECPFIKYKEASAPALRHYRTLIFGGWLNAGKIQGLDWLRKNIKEFDEQNIILYCTGATPAENQDLEKIASENLTDGLEGLPLFYLPGGINLDSLGGFSKMLIKMIARSYKKSNPAQAKALTEGCDMTHPDLVAPLVKLAKEKGKTKE